MKNKNENRKPVPDKVKKGFRRYCTAVMAAAPSRRLRQTIRWQ